MKKNKILPILLLCLTALYQCKSLENKKVDQKTESSKRPQKESIKNSLSYYSFGLYYKNLATKSKNSNDKNTYLTKAITLFLKAAVPGESLDRIYFQISDCYYYINDFKKSLDYAKRSIAVNNKNILPYSRIFSIYNKLLNYRKAAGIYEDYLKINKKNIKINYMLARYYYLKLSDLNTAIVYFNNVIRISDSSNIENYYKGNTYYSLGYIYYKLSKFDKAIINYKKAWEIDYNNINSAYMLAILYMDKYKIDEAEKYSKIYLNKIPHNKLIHSILGRIKYLRNEIGAISHLAHSKNLNTINGYLTRGMYYELMGKDQIAKRYLKKVILQIPKYISPHIGLAKISLKMNNKKVAFTEFSSAGIKAYKNKLFDTAKYCFNEAAKINDTFPEIHFYLARIYEEKKNMSLAILKYKKVNSLKPSIDLLLHIGYLYSTKNNNKRSFVYYDKAIAMDPKNSKPHFLKGLYSLKKNNYSIAETNIKKAISLNSKSERYYFYLAIVQEKQKKFNDAVDSLEKAIKYDPKSARAYNYLGYLYADKNIKISRSFYLIQKALKIDPDNGAYIDSLGWVYYRKGKYKLALKKLLRAEKELHNNETPDPVVYDHIGDTYKKIGDVKKAIDFWKQSLKIKKDIKIKNKIKQNQK